MKICSARRDTAIGGGTLILYPGKVHVLDIACLSNANPVNEPSLTLTAPRERAT
jgi:hypothetical protein